MLTQQHVQFIVQIVLIVAALNWGLVAYNNTDLVRIVTGGGQFERYAKFAVGAAGLYGVYQMYQLYQVYEMTQKLKEKATA